MKNYVTVVVYGLCLFQPLAAHGQSMSVISNEPVQKFSADVSVAAGGWLSDVPLNLYIAKDDTIEGAFARAKSTDAGDESIYYCFDDNDPDTCICIANCSGGGGPLLEVPDLFVSPPSILDLFEHKRQVSLEPLYRAEIKMPEGSSEPVRFPEFLVNEYGDLRGVNALGSSSTATFTDQSVGSCFRWCPDPERQDECINIGACPGGTGGPADIYDVVTISPRYSTSSDRVDYDISIQAEVLASPKTYSVEGFYLTNDGKIDAGE